MYYVSAAFKVVDSPGSGTQACHVPVWQQPARVHICAWAKVIEALTATTLFLAKYTFTYESIHEQFKHSKAGTFYH